MQNPIPQQFPRDKAPIMRSDQVMQQVIYALLPGCLLSFYFFGVAVLFSLCITITAALFAESLHAKLRQKPLQRLDINTAIITAIIVALALPAFAPWWLFVFAILFALCFGKYVYGGVGFNLFNPALCGFCAAYLAFPAYFARYPLTDLSFSMAIAAQFSHITLPDAISGATALAKSKVNADLPSLPLESVLLSLTWFVSGLYLWWKKIVDGRLFFGFLASFVLFAGLFLYLTGQPFEALIFHILVGSLLFSAAFVITDPVSAASNQKARLYYALLCGFVAAVLRLYSQMPDSMAFAILFGNSVAPLIDHYVKTTY